MARFSENHYATLGVSKDASLSEIRRAYHEAALRFHPDTSKEAFATDRFLKIQEAYDVLSSPARRKGYNKTLPDTQENAGIQLRVSYSRPSLLRQTTPQLIYVLLEALVDPSSTVMDSPPLNLCLVIDRSTSMKGSRLDMVKTTARRLIHQLRQEDNLSIVAFSDRAEVILPASRGFDSKVLELAPQPAASWGWNGNIFRSDSGNGANSKEFKTLQYQSYSFDYGWTHLW